MGEDDTKLNNTNFSEKPVVQARKQKTAKPAFFDSDDDDVPTQPTRK